MTNCLSEITDEISKTEYPVKLIIINENNEPDVAEGADSVLAFVLTKDNAKAILNGNITPRTLKIYKKLVKESIKGLERQYKEKIKLWKK